MAPYFGGTFYSVDLASWLGSSGGPIIDVERSRKQGRPILVGILMSEGWRTCDSGIQPTTKNTFNLNEVLYNSPEENIPRIDKISENDSDIKNSELSAQSQDLQKDNNFNPSPPENFDVSSETIPNDISFNDQSPPPGAPPLASNSNQ